MGLLLHMLQRSWLTQYLATFLAVLFLVLFSFTSDVSAVAKMVQVKTAATNGATVSATLSPVAKQGHLLVIVCASRSATVFTVPPGFTLAKSESATAPTQTIYYKIATGGEATFSCAGGSKSRRGIQLYEYSGTATSSVLEAVNPGNSTGTSTTASSGTVTTTSPNTLLLASVVALSAGTGISTWSNSFSERTDFTSTARFGGADRYATTAGNYSTVATMSVSSTWDGQIVAFRLLPIELSADIVNASNVSITNPSVQFTSKTFDFGCQTSTGTLGTPTEQLRVVNTTSGALWTLKIAATNGSTAFWSDTSGVDKYDFNDSWNGGCGSGLDGDNIGGQLSVNPSVATVTPDASCSATGVTKGSSTAFSEGTVDSITLLSGASNSETNCMWNVEGITLSQKIPAEAKPSSYSLGLTLTLLAN